MALLVFKTSVGLNKVPGGFDSHTSPPARTRWSVGKLASWGAASRRVESPGGSITPLQHPGTHCLMIRVPQPPVNAALRDAERHDFWPAFVVLLIGGGLLVGGARHVTELETTDGGTATEVQLIKAFSRGGLEQVEGVAAVDPATFDDPAAAAAALERMIEEEARAPRFKFLVNTGAVDPCPT